MQEEQTGKKRQEKLEWMYATPATGSNQNSNELEDYLLGKKRVDKILTAGENEKVRLPILASYPVADQVNGCQLGASHKNFIATQYANTARDTASKIREDPLLAIKQQEKAAYEALMSNPLRLREMQERAGIKPKKEKKDKKEKKEKKHKKDKHRERSVSPYDDYRRSDSRDNRPRRRSPSPYDRRSRSPPPYRSRYDDDYPRRRERSRTPDNRRREPSPSYDRERDVRRQDDRVRTWPKSDESDEGYDRRRSTHGDDRKRRRSRSRTPPRYDPPPKRSRMSPPPHQAQSSSRAADGRAARLAAMSADASSLTVDRRERLAQLLEKEKAEAEAEERARAKSKGMGDFLSHEQKKVFGGAGGLEERIRRGRGQMRVDGD